jgi:hypothetical protein
VLDRKQGLRHTDRQASRSSPLLVRRVGAVLREEGLFALLLAAFRRCIFDYRRFYLYEHRHVVRGAAMFLPTLDAFDEYFVVSNDTADHLAKERQDFRDIVPGARCALDRGAVAFCVYAGHELAHVGWLAMSAPARRALDHLGYDVDFESGEGWTGRAYTVRRYRGKGLLAYSCLRRFEYLLDSGVARSRAAVDMGNPGSHRTTMGFGPQVYAIGCQLRLFCWRRWVERPPGQ